MRWLLLFAPLLLTAAAPPARPPLVLAASSLEEAMNDAASDWARRGHARPTISFAASSALARQLTAGGHADLFASADTDWMDAVEQRGLLAPGTRATLARNRLVVVARAGRRGVAGLRGAALARVLGSGPLAMADPQSVPAGKYGRAALVRLGAWTGVAPRVVRAENVRAALALVVRGAAPYGIVYATDARAQPGLVVAGVFPARSHPPIIYPVARLAGARSAEAEGFRRFLLGPAGRAVLARHGFAAP